MYRYLISATAYRQSEENTNAYAPRNFTFEINREEPWDGCDQRSLKELAHQHCHRIYGFTPKGFPQINDVHLVHQRHLDALQSILDLVAGAEKNDVWEHITPFHILELIPCESDEKVWLPRQTVEGSAPEVSEAENFEDDNLI